MTASVLEVRRRELGLTRGELARAVGVRPCQVRIAEEGGRPLPPSCRELVAEELGLEPSMLFHDDGSLVMSNRQLPRESVGEVETLPARLASIVVRGQI